MTKVTTFAYDEFVIESAAQYLHTVVLIDDKIYDSKSGSVASHMTTPQTARRKATLKSVASSTDKSGKESDKAEMPEEPDEVSFHEVQNSFAKKRIICSLYQPKKNASFGEQSDVYKLCSTADVVIVDWDLHGDSGIKATTLVGSLVEQSQVEMPYQLRLVLIYTLDPNLQSVAKKIFKHLVELLSAEKVIVDPQFKELVITTENARIVVLGKRESTVFDQFSDYWVPERDLATRTIKEFSLLASGLLQGIVLRGIANLRKNNRRILARFHQDMDIAFLTHRTLSLPDETFGQVVPLLTDELRAVLEDMLGDSPLGRPSAVKQILDAWCDKHFKVADNTKLDIIDCSKDKEFFKDVCCRSATKKEKKILLKNCKTDDFHKKFSSLMSQRVKYNNSRRTLHLGVIVKELTDDKRYLLCLQPVCDSVRIEGENRAFVFCILKKIDEGNSFTHCVIDSDSNVIKLNYKPKVFSSFVSFFSGTDTVNAQKSDNKFLFKDENEKAYEWIAELKTEHAQRAAEQFGREFSRVGLTESEWLRIKAR